MAEYKATGNVQFLGVARVQDRAIVAGHAYNSSIDYNGVKEVRAPPTALCTVDCRLSSSVPPSSPRESFLESGRVLNPCRRGGGTPAGPQERPAVGAAGCALLVLVGRLGVAPHVG
jgi:hypothetical protein